MKKVIIGFIGKLASGKGTVTKYLGEKYGCKTYRFSTMLRDVLDRLYIEKNRENLQKISQVLRENFSQDLLSKVIAEDVAKDPGGLVVIDGVRRPTDIAYLEKNPAFKLIYINADPKIRWERLVKRNENTYDDKKTYEEFCHDETAEAEIQIEALGKKAAHSINNNGSLNDLYTQIEKILSKLKNEN